jgi:hypothetical protein
MKRECKQAEQGSPPWVTPERFVEAWQTSRTLREVCSRLKMRRAAVKVRAHRYRQRGVPLKQHEPDPPLVMFPVWEDLAKYAVSLLAPSDTPGAASRDVPTGEPQPASTVPPAP